jgi:hypothetical protein
MGVYGGMASNVTAHQSPFSRFFRNPETGEVVIAQVPNLPLIVFFVATAARLLFHPHGAVGMAVSVVSGLALAWWSVDEILRGDSPFRRVLGGVVLVGMIVSLLMH